MIKNIAFRIIRTRLHKHLPHLNKLIYNKIFSLTYKLFLNIKPSQILMIVLTLLKIVDNKTFFAIPSIYLLFGSIFQNSNEEVLTFKLLLNKLEENKLLIEDKNFENFFWSIIVLALLKRFTNNIFSLLWLPFKFAFYCYILKYFGYNFEYCYNVVNTLSLGTVDWFYDKITDFVNNLKIDKNP